jgi:hypothetical protein
MELPGVAVALTGRGMVPPPRRRGSSPSNQSTADPSNGGQRSGGQEGAGSAARPRDAVVAEMTESRSRCRVEIDPLHVGSGVSSGGSGRGRDESAVPGVRDEWIGGRRRLGRKRLGWERTG